MGPDPLHPRHPCASLTGGRMPRTGESAGISITKKVDISCLGSPTEPKVTDPDGSTKRKTVRRRDPYLGQDQKA